MKKTTLLLWGLLLGSLALSAQDARRVKIRAGEDIQKVYTRIEYYSHPEFREGKVSFHANQGITAVRFNYNLLVEEMQFIHSNGDTLSLGNPLSIKSIVVGEDAYLYNPESKNFVKVIADYQAVKLAVNQKLKIANREKAAGYGQASSTSAIKNVGMYGTGGRVHKLQVQEDVVLVKETSFYLIDENNRVQPAQRSTVLNLFAENRKTVEKFIKENRIDFDKEEDLKKLLRFCSGLG